MTIDARDITGLILAGGRGARMGGVDKGWVEYRGRPLVETVVQRFAPQVGQLLISANRNVERYSTLAEVVEDGADAGERFAGPLLGVLAGLRRTHSPWMAFVPCDAPGLPADLVTRLAGAVDGLATCARVHRQVQPAFGLVRTSTAGALAEFLAAGGRALHSWLESIDAVAVEFDDASEFRNINSPQDASAEAFGKAS